MQLSIAGRYLVYVPQGEGVGVSRRLEDKERDRLRKQAAKLDLGEGGAIIRTAARGASRADFDREIKYLHKLYELLQKRAKETVAPAMVFQEADLSVRVVRDIFSAHFEDALVDDDKAYQRLVSFLTRTAPELVERVELYKGDQPLFEQFGIDKVMKSTLSRRVDLPSGGYLIIDYAEAMTVIDINSGSFTGRGKGARLEDTISKTNLEAAEEVVRQLRLRDIGGIIVIDFIDMARARNRDAVLKTLRKALDEDRTKTYVMEISPLGLVEMTRQNVTDGVREILTKPCPTCNGDGVVLSEETVAIEVERKLRELATEKPKVEAFLIQVNPRVSSVLLGGPGRPPLLELEEEVGKHFHFEGSEGLPIDHFAVTLEGTRAEVEERALPFREGEEVLVTIEEPHMYNEDDAVAKVDGYVISVSRGVKHLGEKRLVRIEGVSRSAASATIVDNGATSEEDKEQEEKPKRTRGRRGGRGRRTKAASE
jgi:ribonuclease G